SSKDPSLNLRFSLSLSLSLTLADHPFAVKLDLASCSLILNSAC
ncbi:unnamed protein product, partial [Prunus brigantina]